MNDANVIIRVDVKCFVGSLISDLIVKPIFAFHIHCGYYDSIIQVKSCSRRALDYFPLIGDKAPLPACDNSEVVRA